MKSVILLIVLIFFLKPIRGSSCYKQGNNLQCNVTSSCTVDTSSIDVTGIAWIEIVYSNTTFLDIKTSSVDLLRIRPVDGSDGHILRIVSIDTTAARVEIMINLSLNQTALPLFFAANPMLTATSTLSIYVKQMYQDTASFEIFACSNLPTVTLSKYELVFDNSTSLSGNLSFPDLVCGLKNVSSLLISGNKHWLTTISSQLSDLQSVQKLTLRNLRLHDQILYNIINLNEYIIEGCDYDRTAEILQSDRAQNLSLIMRNNNPLDSILPNGSNAFYGRIAYKSITLIEPNLTSSCLKAIVGSKLGLLTLTLDLGIYNPADFVEWKSNSPILWDLKIFGIRNLSILPPKFFNSIDSLHSLVLQGTYPLQKSDICIFAGINVPDSTAKPLITLHSSQNPQNWDSCADTYIKAINTKSMADIVCPSNNTDEGCQQWCTATEKCSLISFENSCPGITLTRVKPFFYNNSYLYFFFQQGLWTERPTDPTSYPKDDSINIAAIIGAMCGLLVAIIILGTTIFCIYRNRNNNSNKNLTSSSEKKYMYSSDDPTHVSIATSKTSQSSRTELQKSFFPPIHPNDEIAPPLYTAPSESVRSTSVYNHPSAPAAPRDSISTHATHVYETVDS
ncbi:unnamed protein product [Adineta ricciae]|uniref:Uncharacterized protein n=1 Tax=Adineta ricciae TaxID=249248 RepID=A0A814QYS4_ADIRI|nr:unnamed protein product [Adineta ricciae]